MQARDMIKRDEARDRLHGGWQTLKGALILVAQHHINSQAVEIEQ